MHGQSPIRESSPHWDELYDTAQSQLGYFTTQQAATAGYSSQLLDKYLANGKLVRVQRSIYRLVHFPPSEEEYLVLPWLWAGRVGAFSHETALALHDLSDALPSKLHMTMPIAWRHRRLRVPQGLVLHYADLSEAEQTGYSAVHITAPGRTLRDCIDANVDPDLLRQAVTQAQRRGLISKSEEAQLNSTLELAMSTPG